MAQEAFYLPDFQVSWTIALTALLTPDARRPAMRCETAPAGAKSGAEYVRDIARRNPDMAEPVEMMAEAALALCSGSILGQICYSRQLVHSMGISVKSLDGQTILGSALLPADLDASV